MKANGMLDGDRCDKKCSSWMEQTNGSVRKSGIDQMKGLTVAKR
jgi:hypothetical protein